jgi:tetratricopeptide (TPR) repeat protein
MKQCPFCHKSIEDDDIQCRYCDEWLDIIPSTRKKKTCPFCHKKIDSDEIQCRYCGEWLDIIEPPTKKKKNVQAPAEKQSELKKTWDTYGHIIAAVIIVLVFVIAYQVNHKAAFEESTKQTTPKASMKTDAASMEFLKSAPVQESAQEKKPASSRILAEDYFNKARSLCYTGKCTDPKKAIEYLNETIKLEPDFAQAYNNRGLIYSSLGRYQQAIEDYNESIRWKPDYAHAYYNRGCSYGSLGQSKQAIEDYGECIRLKPDDVDSYYNRAIIYLAQGNKELGCSDAQKACELGDCKALEKAKAKGVCH